MGDGPWNVCRGKYRTEYVGYTYDEYDHCRGCHRFFHGIDQLLQGQLPVNQAEDQGIDGSDGRRFGGSEDSAVDASKNQYREEDDAQGSPDRSSQFL